INKETVQVRAHIREMKILSSHADLPRLLKWVGHIKGVKKVFLTHGELPQQEELKAHITSTLSLKEVYLPQNGEEFPLSSVEIA
ncbi:MAG: metallo-beta-lactamase family protein, partial [Patescibacteria group bacterium]|nr:metallo-beta-lactamase family protein [Patescibacteria group bacterium]